MRNKIIVIITVLLIVLSTSVTKGIQAFNNSPRCSSAKSQKIAHYLFEVNQKEFSFDQISNCTSKIKNSKTIKKVDENYYCECDLVLNMENGDIYNKKLYYVSAKYSGNPMVMLENKSFTEKAVLIKSAK